MQEKLAKIGGQAIIYAIVTLATYVFAAGRMVGKVDSIDQRVTRIENKLDQLLDMKR